MQYYSLNGYPEKVDFKEAVLQSIAPDKGLYFPEEIPALNPEIIKNYKTIPFLDLCFEVIKPFVGGAIPDEDLKDIISETLNFPTPVKPIHDNISVLELFHGPTLAFKDVGARFMSRVLSYFNKNTSHKNTILVATSGDTGGAVADGFFNVPNIGVVILYPKNKVSPLQEKQLTALGGNIKAIEIDGNFDDCQNLVKTAFLDSELKEKYGLTSANSINVARWLPQMFYYLSALQQMNGEVTICVPSGNFGNICAGMMVQQLGFPIKHFIAGVNANKVVPNYLMTGHYEPKDTISTISNAMDVADPSNFVRITTLYKNINNLKEHLTAYSWTDGQTKEAIKNIYKEYQYLLDPHGAVGYLALKKFLDLEMETGEAIFLETAHPVKFSETIKEAVGFEPEIPEKLKILMTQEKKVKQCSKNYEDFKTILETVSQ